MSVIKHFEKLGFTVVAEPQDMSVYYTIYDHEGKDLEGNFLYHEAGATCNPSPVDNLDEAEPYLHGIVKWDGCSDWHFDEQDRVMLHGCSREDVVRFGMIIGECWDWTAELCPNWYE